MTLPTLVVGFNRPELLIESLNALRVAGAIQLFVFIDGPRSSVPSDIEKVQHCRQIVDNVDWAETTTRFEAQNLGCGKGVSTAIDWFFSFVGNEFGAIVEDDILVSSGFFEYMSKNLNRFATNKSIFGIAAANAVPLPVLLPACELRLSRFPSVWGWGTWRDRWVDYEFGIQGWKSSWPLNRRIATLRNPLHVAYWTRVLNKVESGKLDTWDFQLALAMQKDERYFVVPRNSLVRNIGFGPEASHTKQDPSHQLVYSPGLADSARQVPMLNTQADHWMMTNGYNASLRVVLGKAFSLIR